MTGSLPIRFTDHARLQLSERRISRKEVVATVRRPDNVVRQSAQRLIAVRTIRNQRKKRILSVVAYEHTPATIEVVTVFRTSKIKKYL